MPLVFFFFLSLSLDPPPPRLNDKIKRKFFLFPIETGPRRPSRRQGGMGETAQGGNEKRGRGKENAEGVSFRCLSLFSERKRPKKNRNEKKKKTETKKKKPSPPPPSFFQELQALIAYVQMNKAADSDWFTITADKGGTKVKKKNERERERKERRRRRSCAAAPLPPSSQPNPHPKQKKSSPSRPFSL